MIVVVDYGMGNLGSILNMLHKVGVPGVISAEPSEIARADKLILPGVGAFDRGMQNLAERNLIPLLNDLVLEQRKPILGLCLGMQLFTRRSEEGQLPGLGWLDAETVRFRFAGPPPVLKVPHMGWNTLQPCANHPLFRDLGDEPRFYFVHSFYVVCGNQEEVLAQTRYGGDFASVVGKQNILGVQFHPEKSHRFGMALLRNFAESV